MKVEIKVPQMGESVNEAVIGTILVPNGSIVKMDDEILELETDKVNQVLTAPRDGKLELIVKAGDTVKIGQLLGHVDAEVGSSGVATPPEPPKPEPKGETVAPKPVAAPALPSPPTEKEGIESARYTQAAYVRDLQSPQEPTVESILKPAAAPGRETRHRMTKIRQVIARRLVEAQRTAAMLTTFNEIDMSRVMMLRETHRETFQKQHGVKLGFMSWFVKGVVAALQHIPPLNSYIDGDEIVHREYYDIGIAVGTERGLMVPVVRDCDKLSFAEVERCIIDFATKAREGKISVDDLQGGSFTITNGGIYGSLLSTPILNAPQSGILGMHAIQQRPVAIDGEVQIRPMMYVALSYDHRIVDGEGAVTFLVKLKQYIETPSALLLEL